MQQGGPQYSPQGADWYQAQQYAQPYAQAQAQTQTYAQPWAQSQSQVYAQPYAQPQAQPYAQPQAQPYAQPQAQPYAQPQAQPYAQPYAQPQAQPYAQPQTQATPVSPVAAPQSPISAGAGAQSSPQQQFARHLMSIARTLEQAIPGYQILISVMLDLSASPKGQTISGLSELLRQLEQAAFVHYGTLGAVRRFLLGEASQEVLNSLALGVNRLMSLHSQTRPLWDRALMSASPEVRQVLSNLNQVVAGGGSLLGQAAQGVQTAVGPQVWAAVQAQVQSTPSESAGSEQA